MRKVTISLAAAAATLAVAAPASAQVYGNVGIGIGGPAYGNAGPYGYGYGNVARFQNQLQQIRYEMRNLAVQGRLDRREARDLHRDVRSAEREVQEASYRGISPREAQRLEQRMARLQYEVRRYSDYDGRRWGRGYKNGYGDRDWDGDRD